MERLIWMVLICVAFILGFCTGQRSVDCPEIKEDTTKTIEVEKKRDTIFPDTNKVIKKKFKPNPKFYKDPIKQRTFTVYKDSLNDSCVAITVTDTLEDGFIKDREIAYRLKVPLMIIDSIKVTETITIIKKVNIPTPAGGLFAGLTLGTNFKGTYIIAPALEYVSKKGLAYEYSYDLSNRIHSAGIKKRIK